MKINMRLFKRGDWYYMEFYRGKKKALRTKDPDEAKALYDEIRKEYLRGKIHNLDQGKRITLSEFKKEFIEFREKDPELSSDTLRADKLGLKLLIDSLGGSTALRAVNKKKLDTFRDDCLARKCKLNSINTYLRHIKAAMGYAEEWYKGYRRPKIKFYKTKKRVHRILSLEEVRKLQATAKKEMPWFHPMVEIWLWTGVRRTEIKSMRWETTELEKAPYTIVRGKGDHERIVPLLAGAVKVLKPMKQDIGPVFRQVHKDTYTHWFIKLRNKCGINARLHDLRHTAATYMLSQGTRLEVVQKILGHADISTTKIYAELLTEVLHQEMKLDY